MEKGATYFQLSLMSLIWLPYSFKFMMSPIVDTYFSESFGKRKSYIIPTQYIASGALFWLSYHIESLIDNNELVYLMLIFFTLVVCVVFQDIAVDDWAIVGVDKEYLSYSSGMERFGMTTGFLISYNLFLNLNSVKFCNKFIWSTP